MKRTAIISDCGKYRYNLKRVWDPSKGSVTFIMLNPSTADAENDDPTIRRLIGFSRYWEFGGISVVNLFGHRSSNPKELYTTKLPEGLENEDYIFRECYDTNLVVCAWGNHGIHKGQGNHIKLMLRNANLATYCFKLSTTGQPVHPLYQKGSIKVEQLIEFTK